MKIAYRPWPSQKMNPEHAKIIAQADAFATQYAAQGYSLTLRQLYYRFVAADLIANRQTEYKRLGDLIADARYAGYIDWNHLEDRTRNSRSMSHWNDPAQIVRGAARGYHIDLWDGQPQRVEVWVEKDALVDVVGQASEAFDVTYFSCRGYTSSSEIHGAAMRLLGYIRGSVSEETAENMPHDQDGSVRPVIIHLGDHDPSGVDMSTDIESRLMEFLYGELNRRGESIPTWMEQFGHYSEYAKPWEAYNKALVDGAIEPVLVKRVALNRDQVLQYNPPPNPAKTTDSRYDRYVQRTGLDESWELDALEPSVLDTLVRDRIQDYLDVDLYEAREAERDSARTSLMVFSDHYGEIRRYAEKQGWGSAS